MTSGDTPSMYHFTAMIAEATDAELTTNLNQLGWLPRLPALSSNTAATQTKTAICHRVSTN